MVIVRLLYIFAKATVLGGEDAAESMERQGLKAPASWSEAGSSVR
jgi:hypothetical protein